MITIEQLKELKDRVDALNRYLAIDEKKVELEEEQLRTQAPGFWDNPKEAEVQMKKVKDIQKWIDGYKEAKTATDEVEVAFDFYKEEMITEAEVDEAYTAALSIIENLELRNMLRQEADGMSAVLKINAGAGGTEAQDWAQMLMRMYQRWAEAHQYKLTISNFQDGDEAGIKTVTMEIEGDTAYGYLKSENGVHRLVRVSPYNAQGKRMTSFASVFVTPLVDDSIEVVIDKSKLSWDTFRSSGAGGFLGVVLIAAIGCGLALSLLNAGAIILTVVGVLFFNYMGTLLELVLHLNHVSNPEYVLCFFPSYFTTYLSTMMAMQISTGVEVWMVLEAIAGIALISGGFYALGTFVFHERDFK